MGLVGYLVFLVAAFVAAWRCAWRNKGWQRGVGLAALGMLGHLAAHSMVDNLYVHSMYLVVAMLLGMVAALSHGSLFRHDENTTVTTIIPTQGAVSEGK